MNYRWRWQWVCWCSWLLRGLHMMHWQHTHLNVHNYIHVCTFVSSYCCDLHCAVNHAFPSPLSPPYSPLICFTARGDVIVRWWSTNQTNPCSPAPKYQRTEMSLFLWPLYFFAPTSCLHSKAPAACHWLVARTTGPQPFWPNLSPVH